MVLKYLLKNYPLPTLYFGIANVIANGLVMLRSVLCPNTTGLVDTIANLTCLVL